MSAEYVGGGVGLKKIKVWANDQLVCSCVLIVFSPGLRTHFKNLNSLKFC